MSGADPAADAGAFEALLAQRVALQGAAAPGAYGQAALAQGGFGQAALAPGAYGQATLPLGGLAQSGAAAGQVVGDGGYAWAEQLAQRFGLTVTSTHRSPEENARVGGSPTSAHLTQGGAADFAGPPEAMRRLAEWAVDSGAFGEVFYDPLGRYWDDGRVVSGGIGGHSDHVHISLGAPSASAPAAAGIV